MRSNVRDESCKVQKMIKGDKSLQCVLGELSHIESLVWGMKMLSTTIAHKSV